MSKEKKFDDSYIEKIYENCIRNMDNTRDSWNTVIDFMTDQAEKHPEKKEGLLECINALEDYFKEGDKNGMEESDAY